MMMGGSQQQQQQQQQPQSQQGASQQPFAPYMMQQGGMKAGAMQQQSQQYYGNMSMGRQVMAQSALPGQPQHLGNQMQKPPQDYASFQQQQMPHRFPRGGMGVSLIFKRPSCARYGRIAFSVLILTGLFSKENLCLAALKSKQSLSLALHSTRPIYIRYTSNKQRLRFSPTLLQICLILFGTCFRSVNLP